MVTITDIGSSVYAPYGFCSQKLLNYLVLSVSRNVSCALNLISKFELNQKTNRLRLRTITVDVKDLYND